MTEKAANDGACEPRPPPPPLQLPPRRSDDGLPTPLHGMPTLRPWPPERTPSALEDRYDLGLALGEGSFARVSMAQCRKTGEKRAVKSIDTTTLKEQWMVLQLEQEIFIAGRVQHPYIVGLYELLIDDGKVHLIMELCEGVSLFEKVDTYPHDSEFRMVTYFGLPMHMVAKYMWQMLAGLAYLHHHNIVHRDVKPENYITTDRWDDASPLKLIDFGFACLIKAGERLSLRVGSHYCMAPEVFEGSYDERCDVYSLGVCGFFTCTADYPFKGPTNKAIMEKVLEGGVEMNESAWREVPREVAGLIQDLCSRDAADRPLLVDLAAKKDGFLRKKGWDPRELEVPSGQQSTCTCS